MCQTLLSKRPSHLPLKIQHPSPSASHRIEYAQFSDQALDIVVHQVRSSVSRVLSSRDQAETSRVSGILYYHSIKAPPPTSQTRGAAHPEPEKRQPTHRYLCKLQCPVRLPAHPSPLTSTLFPPTPTYPSRSAASLGVGILPSAPESEGPSHKSSRCFRSLRKASG